VSSDTTIRLRRW